MSTMSYKEVIDKSKTITSIDKEMDKRVIKMADRTWNYIGMDVLEGSGSMSRSSVIEIVSDADHMFSHGYDPEAYAYFLFLNSNHESHLSKLMVEAFPFKRYVG